MERGSSMIQLPPGFDVVLFVSELYSFAVPFAGIIWLMGVGYLIIKSFRRIL